MTRVKNYVGITINSIEVLLKSSYFTEQIFEVIIGSNQLLNQYQVNQFSANGLEHPLIIRGSWNRISKGFRKINSRMKSY